MLKTRIIMHPYVFNIEFHVVQLSQNFKLLGERAIDVCEGNAFSWSLSELEIKSSIFVGIVAASC